MTYRLLYKLEGVEISELSTFGDIRQKMSNDDFWDLCSLAEDFRFTRSVGLWNDYKFEDACLNESGLAFFQIFGASFNDVRNFLTAESAEFSSNENCLLINGETGRVRVQELHRKKHRMEHWSDFWGQDFKKTGDINDAFFGFQLMSLVDAKQPVGQSDRLRAGCGMYIFPS